MRKYIEKHLITTVFKDFYSADITPVEENIATNGIKEIFTPVILRALCWAALGLPATITLDTSNVSLFLTPIAFIAGTAWFIISLSTIKLKFKNFSVDITKNIFESFLTSLFLMLFIAVIALNSSIFAVKMIFPELIMYYLKIASVLLASTVAIRIVYLIVIGSIQYATNDAMLTGQRELMQEYYRRSLSFLYLVADLIRKESDVKVTNYYISDAFSRIFNIAKNYVKKQSKQNYGKKLEEIENLNNKALEVLSCPEKNQEKIQHIFYSLLTGFKDLLNPNNKAAQKINYINIEYQCLEKGHDSPRATALRYGTVFALIYEILQDEGEDIFL